MPFIVAAVFPPGDAAWTTVVEPLATRDHFRPATPAQINGEIVLSDFLSLLAVRLRVTGGRMTDLTQTWCAFHDPVGEPGSAPYAYNVESRGELLLVHVRVGGWGADQLLDFFSGGPWRTATGQAGSLSLSVYALELGAGGGTPRWVWRDGRSLRGRVLFLGHPASFAADAARFGGAIDAGCAYLVLRSRRHIWTTLPDACVAVYMYSFLDGSAAVVADRSCRTDGRLGRAPCGSCRTLLLWPQPR